MKIERTNKEIIIRIPNTIDIERTQRIIDYLRYLEITSKSESKQEDVNDFVFTFLFSLMLVSCRQQTESQDAPAHHLA